MCVCSCRYGISGVCQEATRCLPITYLGVLPFCSFMTLRFWRYEFGSAGWGNWRKHRGIIIVFCNMQSGEHPRVHVLQTFLSLATWLDLVKKSCGDRLPYTAVVANKSDLREHRAVCPALHNNFVKDNGLYRYRTTACKRKWIIHCETGSCSAIQLIGCEVEGNSANNFNLVP